MTREQYTTTVLQLLALPLDFGEPKQGFIFSPKTFTGPQCRLCGALGEIYMSFRDYKSN